MCKSWSFAVSLVLGSTSVLARGGRASIPPARGWERPQVVGEIAAASLPEASGLAQSKAEPDRLYHINDAGSAPSFVVTDRQGAKPRTVALNIDRVTDTEDLTLGACPDAGFCLYVADIGDNKLKRSSVRLHAVRDTRTLGESVTPAFSATLTYDDGEPHNAESLAIHPSGYVYLLTKESPAVFFRFPLSSLVTQTEITLEKVGFVDLNPWLDGTDKPKKIIPTSMAIRPDGKQIVILTRAAGVAIDIDLAQALGHGREDLNQILADEGGFAERLPMIQLPQSEAVTYVDDGAAILYSSEIAETGGSFSPLVQIMGRP